MTQLDTLTLQKLDAEHHLHPFNDNAALAKRGTRILISLPKAVVTHPSLL